MSKLPNAGDWGRTDAQLLQATSAPDEIRRLDALDSEGWRIGLSHEYALLLDELRLAMGAEFVERLEDAVSKRLRLAKCQTLDRLVIGLLDPESVVIEELRTTRRTEYVPELRMPANACEAADEVYVAKLAADGRLPA
jgi:hypothetical protein